MHATLTRRLRATSNWLEGGNRRHRYSDLLRADFDDQLCSRTRDKVAADGLGTQPCANASCLMGAAGHQDKANANPIAMSATTVAVTACRIRCCPFRTDSRTARSSFASSAACSRQSGQATLAISVAPVEAAAKATMTAETATYLTGSGSATSAPWPRETPTMPISPRIATCAVCHPLADSCTAFKRVSGSLAACRLKMPSIPPSGGAPAPTTRAGRLLAPAAAASDWLVVGLVKTRRPRSRMRRNLCAPAGDSRGSRRIGKPSPALFESRAMGAAFQAPPAASVAFRLSARSLRHRQFRRSRRCPSLAIERLELGHDTRGRAF